MDEEMSALRKNVCTLIMRIDLEEFYQFLQSQTDTTRINFDSCVAEFLEYLEANACDCCPAPSTAEFVVTENAMSNSIEITSRQETLHKANESERIAKFSDTPDLSNILSSPTGSVCEDVIDGLQQIRVDS